MYIYRIHFNNVCLYIVCFYAFENNFKNPIILNLFSIVFLCFCVGYYLLSMANIVVSPNKKRTPPIFVVSVIDIQQIMSSGCFEGYMLIRY